VSDRAGARVGVAIVTHGDYGRAMLEAVRGLVGAHTLEAFDSIVIAPDEPRQVMAARIREAVGRLDRGAGVLILCDLYGSTPWSCCMEVGQGAVVLCGVSLPMLVKLASIDLGGTTPEHLSQVAALTAQKAIKMGAP